MAKNGGPRSSTQHVSGQRGGFRGNRISAALMGVKEAKANPAFKQQGGRGSEAQAICSTGCLTIDRNDTHGPRTLLLSTPGYPRRARVITQTSNRKQRMTKPLANRIAARYGGSRGIGHALAIALAREGAHVVATARTPGGLESSTTPSRPPRRAPPLWCRWRCATAPASPASPAR